MTENFPGGAGEPADDATPQASASGPSVPTADSHENTTEVDHPAVETPAAEPADAPAGQSWYVSPAELPTGVHRVDPTPAESVGGQPIESTGERPAQQATPVYPPLGQTPQQSGPVPLAHVPASQWSPGGHGQPGYQQAPQPTQPGYGGYGPPSGPPTGPITAGYPIGGPPPEPPRRRSRGLIAGIALLALVIGGAAGGLGGYLVSTNDNGNVVNSLDQTQPANQTANAPAGSVQSVANKVLPVVVTIAAEFQDQSGLNGDTGSGVVISSDGKILTNNHVIADAANGGHIQVIFANGKAVDASVVGRDPTTDIAVIQAKNVANLPVAQLGNSAGLAVGQNVVAIGAPFELSGTVTSGIISSLHRPTEAGDSGNSQTTVLDAIQTDAPINPGNSGGPLVNMQGQVVGINSAIYSPNTGGGLQGQGPAGNVGIGFAIPIDQARRIANEIVKTGKAIQTVLGVEVTDNTPNQNGQPSILPNGALIRSVTPGGPAAKAGLKAGAVVVKADGRQVNSSDGLVAAVHAASPGDRMTLTLNNGSTVTVTLGGHPVSVN